MTPKYILCNRFDLGMLPSLTADISITELTLDDVCHLIEEAENHQQQGIHGGWANACSHHESIKLFQNGPILIVANPYETEEGRILKWAQIELM